MEHKEGSSKEDGINTEKTTRRTRDRSVQRADVAAQSDEESSDKQHGKKKIPIKKRVNMKVDEADNDDEERSDEQHGKKQTPDPPIRKRVNIKVNETADEEKQYYWDIMRDTRAEEHLSVPNDRMLDGVYVAVKVTVCIILFLLVLTTAVVSKLCLVLITSNMFPPRNDTNDTTSYWAQKTVHNSISYPTDTTNVQWIWAMVLIISAPYFFTTLSCGWKLIFKNKSSNPGWNGFVMVMILETLHSMGLCMFVFMVLPSLDPFACVMVCFQVAWLPGLLGTISRPTHPSRAWIVKAMLIIGVLLQIGAIGICGYVSFLIISYHTWLPGTKRPSEIGTENSSPEEGPSVDAKGKASSVTPLIYICATMWHETKSEMKKLMQSILRLDKDQDQTNGRHFRDLLLKLDRNFDHDFYNFEVHIFFDDAFKTEVIKGTKIIKVNGYVKDLLEVVQETTGKDDCLKHKIKTQYGGRLEWHLPQGNKMIAHLKNKEKIRVRKRWSQVMYMYYFLGHKILGEAYKCVNGIDDLMQKLENDPHLREQASNTFLLALDGDVDFKPEAVKYLMDRMKKYPNVGAACGRIHPTGNGPVVWYQKFEYAVSHWLQKVAEDTLGCVLCSPGCFSLFRGSALMDNNVMKVYTTPPTEGRHHVQYDQGEDRWLCTLLLQQGYRVEYVAASDALTEAPEGFNEFFNQRRRWSPSTMANILDLLLDWKHVIKQNPDISTVYIFYQAFLMFSSILTPGTIFLMLVGAIHTAYSSIDLWLVFLINIVPLVVFVVLCFNAKSETQLTFAGILSIAYSLVMMLVLIGLVITIVDLGFCSVTTIFFIFVASVFVISALLHPQEFTCIFHGFLYFLAIPATSVVMVLYSLCNLNVTSWGTRESVNTTAANGTGKSGNPRNWFDVSRGALRFLCCSQETDQSYILQRLDQLEKKLDQQIDDNSLLEHPDKAPPSPTVSTVSNSIDDETEIYDNSVREIYEWIRDEKLQNVTLAQLDEDERRFWKYMIKRYLFPLVQTDEEKKRVEEELTALRNKVCLFFILANAMFICIIFTLQQITSQTKSLSIPLPCVTNSGKVDYVEPISLTFTFIFGVLLLVQFVCMLLHRFGTLVHICARTEIFKSETDDDETNYKQLYLDLAQKSTKDKPLTRGRSIFLPRAVKSNKADGHSVGASKMQSRRDTEKESTRRDSFGDKCENVAKFVKRRQTEKRRLRKDQEMKEIYENFPALSEKSRRAIFTLVRGAAPNISADDADTINL